ncbi:NosD domain-containing protein [Halobaculum roseum]|uniref:NosD domain-containing protein n=1 Tax=Halobaculum roseum TaxID=2175149 RepID=A0ABD5MN67_9EURY|nr:right-handed parallel beta-helix repeat-containing protein [Halobaculum roseum]QZY03216.1 hypothetical protein K6T36_03265 [Halobaculum roseum]
MTEDGPVRSPLPSIAAVVLCVVLAAGVVGVSGAVGTIDTVESANVGVLGLDGGEEASLADRDAVRAAPDRGGVPNENTSTLEVIAAEGDRFSYRIVVEGDATSTVVDGHSADRDDTIRYDGDGTVTIAGQTGDGAGDAYLVTGEIRSVQVIGNASPYRIERNDEDVTGSLPTAESDGDAGDAGDADGETDGDGVDEDEPEAATPAPGDGDEDAGADPPDDARTETPEDDTETPESTTEPPADETETPETTTEPSADETEPPERTMEPPADDTETPEQPDETPESEDDPEQPDGTPDGTPAQPDNAPDREIDSCTVVDEPGRYELTEDLAADGDGVCLHVRAPDVVLDGNGNTIAGDGSEDSIGLLVLNGTVGTGDVGDPLTNVTVRDVGVTGFDTGVQAGSFDAVGTSLTLVGVDASGNAGAGVYFNEVDDSTLREITANDNRHGVLLWETYDIEVRGLAVEDNDAQGLYLAQNVGRSTFSDVRAVGNGAGDGGAAIRLSTDVEGNVIVDSVVADNDGPGIAFSDSGDNVIRDTTIEDNAAPGVVGDYPGGDRLERVALRGNGDRQLSVERGAFGVTAVAVGDGVTVSFADGIADLGLNGDDPYEFDTVERASLPGDPPGTPAADEALSVSGATVPTELSFELDGTADSKAVDLWRYDGDGWTRVADGSVTDGQFTATVEAVGVLVPLESADESTTPDEPEGDGTETPTGDETGTETPTGDAGTETEAPQDDATETDTPGSDDDGTEAADSGTETSTPEADDARATLAPDDGESGSDGTETATPTPDPEGTEPPD